MSKNALWLKNDQNLVQQWLQQISNSETFSLQRFKFPLITAFVNTFYLKSSCWLEEKNVFERDLSQKNDRKDVYLPPE